MTALCLALALLHAAWRVAGACFRPAAMRRLGRLRRERG